MYWMHRRVDRLQLATQTGRPRRAPQSQSMPDWQETAGGGSFGPGRREDVRTSTRKAAVITGHAQSAKISCLPSRLTSMVVHECVDKRCTSTG
jgi:hypothetical protein